MRPVKLEIIAYAPTIFIHCAHCELAWDGAGLAQRLRQEQWDNSFPDDLRDEYLQISDLVLKLRAKYGPYFRVSVVDAASIEGFFKSLRYGVRRFPAFVLDGRDKVVGFDLAKVEGLVEQRLLEGAEGR
jgi:hypothetical protein